MKKQIEWLELKSDTDFQALCNKVLIWEVSKDVVPFGALGRDKATDAQFEGTYGGKTGKWRFQAKFHDPTMDKAKARSLVKSDFKKELEKIRSEKPNHYVFMTNVKITKKLFDELMSVASKYDFETQIWDGEKLEALLVKYPFIIAYHFGYDLPLFEPYQEKFKDELEGKKPVINHHYALQGRKQELEDISKLLLGDGVRILLVRGGRGIGKTRLAIEYAKKIEEDKEWTPVFIRTQAEKFEEHLNELSAAKNYVIIADDADSYKDIDKLISLANRHGWSDKIKLILLAKPDSIDSLKKMVFPQYEEKQVIERSLSKLSNEETVNLLKELGVAEEIDQRMMFNICKDSPMLAVMAVKLFREGIRPEHLSQEEIIRKTLDKALDGLRAEHKANHIKFLEILSAVAPISIRDEKIQEKIAGVMGISIEEIKEIIQDLIKEGLIETRAGKIRITPDMLADHILNSKCYDNKGEPTGFHQKIIQDFSDTALKQVIRNIAQTEFKSKTGKTLLDDFSEELISLAPKANNVQRINILDILEEFSYYRPLDSLEAIDQMMKNPQPDMTVKEKFWGDIPVTGDMVTQKIPRILTDVRYRMEALPKALEILKDLALKDKMKKLMGTSAFDVLNEICKLEYGRDVWIREEEKRFYYNDEWHKKMLDAFARWLKEENEEMHVLTLELMKNLLKLECSYVRTVLEDRAKFAWSNVKIVRTKSHSDIRNQLFDLIIETARESKYSDVKARAYRLLGEAVFGIASRKDADEGNCKAEADEETKKLFDSLAEGSKKETHFMVLNIIETGLKTFSRIKGYKEKANALMEKMRENEEYILFKYLVGQHDDWSKTYKADFWEKLTKRYVDKYEEDQTYEFLSTILEQAEKGWFFGPVTTFMLNIGKLKPEYGKKLLERVLKEKNKLLDYAGYLLSGIRLQEKETVMKYLRTFKKAEDIKVQRVVVDSYQMLRDYKEFNQEDIDILKELSLIQDDILRAKIAGVLPNLSYVNKKDYLEILKNASKSPSLLTAGNVADALVHHDIKMLEEDVKNVEEIVSNFIEVASFDRNTMASYHIELVFQKIAEYDPVWVIEFFEKRVDQTEKKKKEDEQYDAIPFSFFEAFKHLSKHEKYKDVLRRVRDWTLKKGWFYFEAQRFFHNLCTPDGRTTHTRLNEAAEEVLMEWVNSKDSEKMARVASLLGEFEEDERFYSITRELIIKSEGDPKILNGLSGAIFSSGGATTRTPGETSPKLLQRMEYLKKLKETSDDIKVKRFAEKEIKNTQAQMQDERERDEEMGL